MFYSCELQQRSVSFVSFSIDAVTRINTPSRDAGMTNTLNAWRQGQQEYFGPDKIMTVNPTLNKILIKNFNALLSLYRLVNRYGFVRAKNRTKEWHTQRRFDGFTHD